MKKKRLILLFMIVMFCFFVLGTNAFADDPHRLPPARLASIGDSITEAIDAEVYGANHWASWANGYHGFWQWLFGLSNVNSHNQRITEEFGRRGRKNFMEAESGADSSDLLGQAMQAVDHQATYVPWLMGHNDICQDYEWQIPDEGEFEENVEAALQHLASELPDGATIYVVGMVDVPKLYEEAQHKKALGIVDCEVLWFSTLFELFPCGTVLGPSQTDDDRDRMHDRIAGNCIPGTEDCTIDGVNFFEGFNPILKRLVGEFDTDDSSHYYFYTDTVFNYPFVESDVSDLDCFHPSPDGQELLSEITWDPSDVPEFQNW